MEKSLLIGCGTSRDKKIIWDGSTEWTGELVTVDINPDCGADLVMDVPKDLCKFKSEQFEEIGAYECLEHWGKQGEWKGWFDEMGEYWRILKPGGIMGITVPINQAALSDPGHCRFFHPNHFGFLNQNFYKENEENKTSFTDYRFYWKLNFDIVFMQEINEGQGLAILLKKA